MRPFHRAPLGVWFAAILANACAPTPMNTAPPLETLPIKKTAEPVPTNSEEPGIGKQEAREVLMGFLSSAMKPDAARGKAAALCAGGSLHGCAVEAYVASTQSSKSKAPEKDAATFKKTCDAGVQLGCTGLVLSKTKLPFYTFPNDAEKKQGLAMLAKACELEEPVACDRRGRYMQLEGNGDQALRSWSKACDLGNPQGCFSAGKALRDGLREDLMNLSGKLLIEPDAARAHAFFQRGCRGGSRFACVAEGEQLRDGHGTDRDAPAALDRFDSACKADEPNGCYAQAQMLAKGDGVTKDVSAAIELLDRQCDGGWKAACNERDALSAALPKPADAAAAEPSCKGGTPYRAAVKTFWPDPKVARLQLRGYGQELLGATPIFNEGWRAHLCCKGGGGPVPLKWMNFKDGKLKFASPAEGELDLKKCTEVRFRPPAKKDGE